VFYIIDLVVLSFAYYSGIILNYAVPNLRYFMVVSSVYSVIMPRLHSGNLCKNPTYTFAVVSRNATAHL